MSDAVPVIPCPVDLPGAVGRVFDAATATRAGGGGDRAVAGDAPPGRPKGSSRRGRQRAAVRCLLSKLPPGEAAAATAVGAPQPGPCPIAGGCRPIRFPRRSLGRASAPRVTSSTISSPTRRRCPGSRMLSAAAGQRPIVVAGSTMEGEEETIAETVSRLEAAGRPVFLILAPRHPERFDAVAELVARRGLAMTRRSTGDAPTAETEVFLLDTIGELARAYRAAAVAFIGGSLATTGGHNPLEAAVWGVPVLSGPHVYNFVEVYDEMTDAGAARSGRRWRRTRHRFGPLARPSDRGRSCRCSRPASGCSKPGRHGAHRGGGA